MKDARSKYPLAGEQLGNLALRLVLPVRQLSTFMHVGPPSANFVVAVTKRRLTVMPVWLLASG